MKSSAMVDRINDYVQELPNCYDRPARKFVREFFAGLLIARTTLISEISKVVGSASNRRFKSTYKRHLRRLDEVDFNAAYEQQQNRAAREITNQTIIAIDIGDITKPHATSLEGLAKVADGSDKHKVKPGYWLISAVAVNPKSEDKTPQPMALRLYSSEAETFYSENTIVNEAIAEIFHRSGGKGTFTIDRGGDRVKILQPMLDLGANFIVRLAKRHVIDVDNESVIPIGKRDLSRNELPHEIILRRRTKNGKRVPMHLRVGYTEVRISSLTKKRPLTLITAWSEKSKKPIELLTSRVVSGLEEATEIVVGYLSRWSVEETYRFLKVDLNLEKLQLRSLGKLQNMIKACFITASILARTTRCSSWRKLFTVHSRRQKNPPEGLYNWLYRAAEGCSKVLKKDLNALLSMNKTIYHARRMTPLALLMFSVEHHL